MLTRSTWRWLSVLVLAVPCEAQQAPSTPRCRESQVAVSITNAGVGMSHWAEGIEFYNTSADTCLLRGVPKIVFSDANNVRLPAAICPNCDDYLFPARPETTVLLNPRDIAHVLIGSSTAYDAKFCSRAKTVGVFLPGEPHPLIAREHELYYCVKVDVSPFLPGSTKSDSLWSGRRQPAPSAFWGPVTQGLQVSLMPFARWQRVGILGFHLAWRGFAASGPHGRKCQSATLRMWQAGKIVQSASSSDRLVCPGLSPGTNSVASDVLRTDVTTQQFGMPVNRSGAFQFDVIETLDAGPPITVTSNRISVMVTNN